MSTSATNAVVNDAVYVLSMMYSEEKAPIGIVTDTLEMFEGVNEDQLNEIQSQLMSEHSLKFFRVSGDLYYVCEPSEVTNILIWSKLSPTLH
jgi:hypothetical protein